MDPLVSRAHSVLASLADFFNEHPPELQWSRDAQLLASVQEPKILDSELMLSIIRRAHQLVDKERNVLELSGHVVVVGDIHGQCCDLLSVFEHTRGGDMIWSDPAPQQSKEQLPNGTELDVELSLTSMGHRRRANCISEGSPGKERRNTRSSPRQARREGENGVTVNGSKEQEEGGAEGEKIVKPVMRMTCHAPPEPGVHERSMSPDSTSSSEGRRTDLRLTAACQHQYLFMGDYVDRGCFSCEVIAFLLCLKVVYPHRVFLLRGNHESRSMTSREYAEGNNFCTECEEKFGSEVYEACMRCFDCLPLAAVVENQLGRWMCCHGGLGPKIKSLEVLSSLDRRCEPPLTGTMCDLLWADPLLEDVLGYRLSDSDYSDFLELDFLPNPPRGCSYFYGYAAIKPFLEENHLLGIIRAHQCKEEGVSYAYTDDRHEVFPFPYVTTVFSASNYCGSYGNRGAVMIFYPDDIQVLKFNWDGETWVESTPYHPPEVTKLVKPPKPPKPAEPEEKEEELERKVAPVIPTPPPLPPILAPVVEVEEEREPEEKQPTPDETQAKKEDDHRHVRLSIFQVGAEPVVRRERRLPMRSQTVNYGPACSMGASALRRKSLVNLQRGITGERGSLKFRAALRKDATHELHPGWNSIRKLGRVVGRVQVSRKNSQDKVQDRGTPIVEKMNPDLSDSISKSLLNRIGENDVNQIKLVFDSIDKNHDGQLSQTELEEFASELGNTHAATFTSEVQRLLHQMDEDRDGSVSFDEFTHYMAAVSLIEATPGPRRQPPALQSEPPPSPPPVQA